MERTDKRELNINWDLYAIAVIIIAVIFQLLRWRLFPMFIDMYYHLSVMLGFDRAGGYVNKAFWEYAPLGRAHLYPPLLHILMLAMYKIGLGKLFIARFLSFIMYPLMLVVLWLFARKLFNRIFAFFLVILLFSSYFFYLEMSNITAFSLSLILGFLGVWAFEARKTVSGVLLLALTFYSHSLSGWLFLLSLLFYGMINKEIRRAVKLSCFVLLLSSPILIHQLTSIRYFRFIDAKVMHYVYIHIFIYLFAFLGLLICIKRKGRYFLLLSLFAGFSPVLLSYKQRFLSGQAMVVIILLAAAGLEYAYNYFLKKDIRNGIKVLLMITFFYLLSPAVLFQDTMPDSLFSSRRKYNFSFFDSTLMNLCLPDAGITPKVLRGPMDALLYNQKFINPLVKIIKENTSEDQVLYSNLSYVSGILGVFSERSTSTAMLSEVKPYKAFDPLLESKLIVWFKDPYAYDIMSPELRLIASKYGLEYVTETELAYIYKNNSASRNVVREKPLLSFPVLFIIVIFVIVIILFFAR